MKKDVKKLDVVFILDKSGSMGGSEKNTISSFNEYLEREKNNSFDTSITTVLFSDHYQYLHKGIPISQVEKLTENDYFVGGCTALYDALGNTISYMSQRKTDKVLFIIITDGYENASVEFNKAVIQKMIKNHSDWEFVYIGADIDSYAVGGDLGIKEENIANYAKNKKGISRLFAAVGNFECAMMNEDSCVSKDSWKDELKDY